MKLILAFILTLAHTLALAAPFNCMPKQLGGSGTNAILRSNTKGDMAAWYCPNKQFPDMVVCLKSTCSLVASKRAGAGFLSAPSLSALNTAMGSYTRDPLHDPELVAVWLPHAAEISALVNK